MEDAINMSPVHLQTYNLIKASLNTALHDDALSAETCDQALNCHLLTA